MTPEESNKYLCQKLGKHWHEQVFGINVIPYERVCSCGRKFNPRDLTLEIHFKKSNPDYCDEAGRIELLREMEEWNKGEYYKFLWNIWNIDLAFCDYDTLPRFLLHYLTELVILGQAGRLVDAAVRFFGEREK